MTTEPLFNRSEFATVLSSAQATRAKYVKMAWRQTRTRASASTASLLFRLGSYCSCKRTQLAR